MINFNMKTTHIIVSGLLILSITIDVYCQSSTSTWKKTNYYDTTLFYKDCISKGNFYNGNKTGKWIEISKAGIIYAESTYDSMGKPIGIWIINFPDGKKRRTTEYSELGIIKWFAYRNNIKLLEVSSVPEIQNNICQLLNDFENDLFESEQKIHKDYKSYYDYGYSVQGAIERRIDPYWASVAVCKLLQTARFDGTLYIFNYDATIRRKCIYKNGNEYQTCYFYNGKKTLTQLDEYINDTIVQTIKGTSKNKFVKKINSTIIICSH